MSNSALHKLIGEIKKVYDNTSFISKEETLKTLEDLKTTSSLQEWLECVETFCHYHKLPEADLERLENIGKLLYKSGRSNDFFTFFIDKTMEKEKWDPAFGTTDDLRHYVYNIIFSALDSRALQFHPVGKIDESGRLVFFEYLDQKDFYDVSKFKSDVTESQEVEENSPTSPLQLLREVREKYPPTMMGEMFQN